MTLNPHLANFFEVEIRNEDQGGVRPSTLDSAMGSLTQAPNDVLMDWTAAGSNENLARALVAFGLLWMHLDHSTELATLL